MEEKTRVEEIITVPPGEKAVVLLENDFILTVSTAKIKELNLAKGAEISILKDELDFPGNEVVVLFKGNVLAGYENI